MDNILDKSKRYWGYFCFVIVCCLSFVFAYYLSIFIHEMGHQLTALLCGARIKGIYVSFNSSYSFSDTIDVCWKRTLAQSAGIIFQFVVSWMVFIYYVDRKKSFYGKLFVIQFGFVGMIDSMTYLLDSYWKGYGDGGKLFNTIGWNEYLVATFVIVVIVVVLRMVLRKTLAFCEKYVDIKSDYWFYVVSLGAVVILPNYLLGKWDENSWLLVLIFIPFVVKALTSYDKHGLESVVFIPKAAWVWSFGLFLLSMIVYTQVFGTSLDVFYGRRNRAAEKFYSELISIKPTKSDYYDNRAMYRFYMNDYDGAIFDLNRLLGLEPENIKMLRQKIYIEQVSSKGNDKVLIEDYKALIRLSDDDKEIRTSVYNIACFYARMGNKDKAIEWFKKAVDIGYDNYFVARFDGDMFLLMKSAEFKKLCNRMRHREHIKPVIIKEMLLKD